MLSDVVRGVTHDLHVSHALLTFFRSSFFKTREEEEAERFLLVPDWPIVWDIGGLVFKDS
jgi:hypothetical protein